MYQGWKFKEYEKDVNSNLGPYGSNVNPIYRNMLTISTFDFSTELDVNILGHIFENSIGDIEELKEDLKGRRKKDGIFYTPDYITDYICRNTIIPYLSKSGKINTVDQLIGEYSGSEIKELDLKVKEIKIIDPACGSGAFLNKAANVLLEIHESIREQLYAKDTLDHVWDPIEERREILLNNIYGVDLNEESVDITKLSLFLKVCRKGLILPNLDNNIKCGNSLIDDPKYTNKPFSWEEEFPDIFYEGGFDVVIGNPPYVRHQGINNIKKYLKVNYDTYTGLSDFYVYFFEKGLDILKNGGMFSYISSDKFIKANYGKKLRKLILNFKFERFNEYKGKGVFIDAKVDPCIVLIKKVNPNFESQIIINDSFQIKQNIYDENSWKFENPKVMDLLEKLDQEGIKIKDIPDLHFHIGVMTGFNEAFIIDGKTKNLLITNDLKNEEIIKPLLAGKDVNRWKIDYRNRYLILSKSGDRTDLDYPTIVEFFKKYEEKLKVRWNKGKYWFNLRDCDYYSEFEKPKLIYPEISQKLFATYDELNFYTNAKCFIITSETTELKFLGALLSSKVLNFIFKYICSPLSRTSANSNEIPRYNLSKSFIELLPIYPATSKQQYQIIEQAEIMLQLNQKLQNEVNGFKHWIQKTFEVEKLSNKLEKYYKLSEDEFIDELRKKKVETKLRKNRDILENEFKTSVQIINPLLKQIYETDNKIDQMIYKLYGLIPEEIKIVEDNLN